MDNTACASFVGSGNVNRDNVTNSNNINNSTVNVNHVVADETLEIMQWLSPLDPRRRHQDVHTERLDGVGNWLLETGEFREWRNSEGGADKAVLFCYGNPGVGKTYLNSLVVDHLCDEPGEENIAAAGFYCDYRDQHDQTTTNIMGAILKQLAVREEVLEHVKAVFHKAKMEVGGRGLRLPDVVAMLKEAVAILPQVFICLDALDEYLPKHLPELLKALDDIVQESPRTRIFVTGRPHVEVEIKRRFTTAVIVPISPNRRDIKRFLENRLEMDTEHDAMPDDLRADILRIIPEKISEIFLLVSLNINTILGEATIAGRRQKLKGITKGNHLGDAYKTTLAGMKTQKGDRPRLGMEALMWVSNSERPLHTSELCHALGVKIGSRDLDPENAPTIRTILGCSLGLITVDASSSIVRLVHFTLQEYLSDNAGLFQSAHSMIAEVCLTYLNFQCVRELLPVVSSAPSTVPLAGYASCYWGEHMRREKTESVSSLALGLLVGFEQHISSQLLLLHYERYRHRREPGFNQRGGPNGFTGFHGAAFLGIVEIVAALLEMKEWDINATDVMGRTALAWAAARGHEDVVKILVQRRDAKVDTPDNEYGRTPLLWGVEREYEGIVKLLLEREDINPNTAETLYGRTPLWQAVESGNEGIVKLLLERKDVNPNTAYTIYSRTPLSWAAERGDEEIVKLLLERKDVNPNTADNEFGQTPLWCAARGGCEGVVKLLLKREDIDPNTADTEYGRTPLWWATEGGNEGIAKLLLEREDIDPNTADTKYGRTPLWWAAARGNEGTAKLLLGREDADPNAADTEDGRTPLSWAAESGNEGIVKLLLEREDIDLNTADTEYGRTPLSWAAARGNEGTARLLLEREDINPNAADTLAGRTPLWWASESGEKGIVELLLKQQDIIPDIADTKHGQTPLWCAARGGYEGVVELLLKREDIDSNTADTWAGRTPLWCAAWGGYEGVVKLLLEREDIDFNTADTRAGRTPLWCAARGGFEGIVELLLEREDIDPNTADTHNSRTPLWWAAKDGHEGIVKLLLERENINPNTADTKHGRTPLEWATEGGHAGVVKLLLGRDDVNPDIPELNGRTAFELATFPGDTGVVELLTEPTLPHPVPASIDGVPDCPFTAPSDLLQSSS